MDLTKYLAKLNITIRVDLTKYLAKPNITIEKHNQDLLDCLNVLNRLGYIKNQHLFELCVAAIIYHDCGKVNREFQIRVTSDGKIKFDGSKEIYHNVLSMFFVEKDKFNDDDYVKILFVVGYHHNYCNVRTVLHNHRNNDLLKNLLADFIEKPVIPQKYIQKFGNVFREKDCILLKGFLHKCDYCASAGNSADRVELINDFLLNAVEGLNYNWNDMQNFCQENTHNNIIVVAQTGMGKTEGALKWIGNNKAFFVLPLKTAINAMYDRIRYGIIKEKIEDRLAILHSESLEHLINNQIANNSDDLGQDDVFKWNEQAKTLSMPLTITTMDQLFDFVFLYAGYELKLTTFSYSKIVIDEIQMYSPDLLAILIKGIEMITEIGGKVAIITATLAPFVRDLLPNNFKFERFLDTSNESKMFRHNVKLENRKINADDIVDKYYENMENDFSNKILVICNTIRQAQSLYSEVKDKLSDEDKTNIYQLHTRFTSLDRRKKESQILAAGKTYNENGEINSKNEIWITTSVVEASLDIDFDYLFTELQDVNSLFQRMGRCNRKGVKNIDSANCFVYTEIDENLLKRNGRGFIDQTIFKLSQEALREGNFEGKVSEAQKLDLIDTYFTTDKLMAKKEELGFSCFLDEYKCKKKALDDMPPYSNPEDGMKECIRDIKSFDVIPYTIYENLKDRFEEIEEEITEISKKIKIAKQNNDVKKTSELELNRIMLRNEIKENVVSIPYYEYSKLKLDTNRPLYVNKNILVVQCNYSEECGFKKDLTNDNYAVFF